VERIQAGDLVAREELLRCVGSRLEALTRKMLRGFPEVQRWNETADVFQNAMLRLLRCLSEVQVTTTRDFLNLAAVHIRRELLDLVRHHSRRIRVVTEGSRDLVHAPAQPIEDDKDLDRWSLFHEAVERLATEEREVVSLIFYHGWTQLEVAQLLEVSERTVRRRWEAALLTLRVVVGVQ